MRAYLSIVAGGALALGLAVTAVHAAPAATPSVRKACDADVKKICAKAGPFGIRKCMRDHYADLSDGCKAAITAMRDANQKQAAGH